MLALTPLPHPTSNTLAPGLRWSTRYSRACACLRNPGCCQIVPQGTLSTALSLIAMFCFIHLHVWSRYSRAEPQPLRCIFVGIRSRQAVELDCRRVATSKREKRLSHATKKSTHVLSVMELHDTILRGSYKQTFLSVAFMASRIRLLLMMPALYKLSTSSSFDEPEQRHAILFVVVLNLRVLRVSGWRRRDGRTVAFDSVNGDDVCDHCMDDECR